MVDHDGMADKMAVEGALKPDVPSATYRLQFNSHFTFDDATKLVPYLHALGVSHIYASPWLRSRTGSTHGYDVVDYNMVEPELGGEEAFNRLHAASYRYGIRHLLDFVPNHMGIGGSSNTWWQTLLEEGRASPTARYFDIEWNLGEPNLCNKLLLPILGEHYGDSLLREAIKLRLDEKSGRFSAWYYRHRLPISIKHYGPILRLASKAACDDDVTVLLALAGYFEAAKQLRPTARRVCMADLTSQLADAVRRSPTLRTVIDECCNMLGKPGADGNPPLLHEILSDQYYRLAYWGTAADEINYRRFFNINELAGLRMENPALFDAAHCLVGRLIAEGKVHGLRIDHVDGLLDPKGYCRRLRDLTDSLAGGEFYIVVEKILATHEQIRADWGVHGTTGYDFISQISNLLVDERGGEELTAVYTEFTGNSENFADVLANAKTDVIEALFGSELRILGRRLHRLTQKFWKTPDFTEQGLTRALRDIAVHLPVYRTYVDRSALHHATARSIEDRRDLDWALERACARWQGPGRDTLTFVASVINGDFERDNPSLAGVGVRFALKFQQFTSPVTAKGMEDTAFYRYHRLISLNEVGCDPRRVGASVNEFHGGNRLRARCFPNSMLATATHDTKRGEDARARIHVLSEIPKDWGHAVRHWATLNACHKTEIAGRPIPNSNEEYLIYQTLVGVWPNENAPDLKGLGERLRAFTLKALREAKQNSLWEQPNQEYEAAVFVFVDRILDTRRAPEFLADFRAFHDLVARAGMMNGLAQVTLKLTAPGVPDIYQGTEVWDYSLVDPDNRRPVDYEARKTSLASIDGSDPAALLLDWKSGRIKTFLTHRLLQLRKEKSEVFRNGGYEPLAVEGRYADHIVAFRRGDDRSGVAVMVIRHSAKLMKDQLWPHGLPLENTVVKLGEVAGVDIFTGRHARGDATVRDTLSLFPFAVLAW